MAHFTAENNSVAVVQADRDAIWAVLTDPELLTELTPFLHRIDVDGERWHWVMTQLPILNLSVAPSFTEVMRFEEPHRIDFTHDPLRTEEKTAAEGSYELVEVDAGTQLSIRLTVTTDLPLPRVAKPAVVLGMQGVMAGMGQRFAANLTRHLGVSVDGD